MREAIATVADEYWSSRKPDNRQYKYQSVKGKIRNGKDMCMDFRNSETPQKLIEALMMCEIIMHLHAMQRYVLRTVSLRNSFADCGSES